MVADVRDVMLEVARLLTREHPEWRVELDDAVYEIHVEDADGNRVVVGGIDPAGEEGSERDG